ncbi:MAG: D-Ala-D-Ala carboxypeptidase family metallohydrolase [candidate division WOR-3 bacterium]
MSKITLDEYLMGRDKVAPLTKEQKTNAQKLLDSVNKLLSFFNKPVKVSSGYRPAQINKSVGGAAQSAHMTCEAVDLADPNSELARWCLKNLDKIKECGLYLEDPRWTPTWVHLQIRAPKSNNTVFIPNSSPPSRQNV